MHLLYWKYIGESNILRSHHYSLRAVLKFSGTFSNDEKNIAPITLFSSPIQITLRWIRGVLVVLIRFIKYVAWKLFFHWKSLSFSIFLFLQTPSVVPLSLWSRKYLAEYTFYAEKSRNQWNVSFSHFIFLSLSFVCEIV